MGLIFLASAQPTMPSAPGRWDLLLKKTMHFLGYAVLTALYLRALRGPQDGAELPDAATTRAISAGLALLYALSDEYHQTFVPGRNGNLVDVAVDMGGVTVVTLLDWLLPVRLLRREGASG